MQVKLPKITSKRRISRVFIGDGVILRYLSTGQVTIRIRSQKPVFVRSGYLDYINRTPYESAHRFMMSDEEITVNLK